jgi:hypothetical protein
MPNLGGAIFFESLDHLSQHFSHLETQTSPIQLRLLTHFLLLLLQLIDLLLLLKLLQLLVSPELI